MKEANSPFRTWNGVEKFELFPGVKLHAVGGEQALVCRVTYDPGVTVSRHLHEHSEQVVILLDGDLTFTIGEHTRRMNPGDTAVVNKGVLHELHSEGGCEFIEALSPVPRDHVPDADRDLVLGEQGDSRHVER